MLCCKTGIREYHTVNTGRTQIGLGEKGGVWAERAVPGNSIRAFRELHQVFRDTLF